METSHLTNISALYEAKKSEESAERMEKLESEVLKLNTEKLEHEKKQVKVAEESNKNIIRLTEEIKRKAKEDSKIIATIASNTKIVDSLGERLLSPFKSIGASIGKLTSVSGIKKAAMSAVNVGGIFNKSLAKTDYVDEQKLLGDKRSTKEIGEDFNKQQTAAKAINKNEAEIEKFKKKGLSENQIARTEPGKKLLDERQRLTSEYSKYDIKTKLSDSDNLSEDEMEAVRIQTEQSELLKQLVKNTGGENKTAGVASPQEAKSGGILDGILGTFSSGFMDAIAKIFSPGLILKAVTKVFLPLAIIGSVVNGIMDGFKEFSESGSIGEALIAGLGGVLEFLTFGLIDKTALKKIFETIKESVDSLFGSIGIPEFKFKLPLINKEVTIPEFYPFRMDKKPTAGEPPSSESPKSSVEPIVPEPTAAKMIEQKSAENSAAAIQQPSSGNNTSVIAPTTNVKNTTSQVVKLPVRNQDQTMSRYLGSRYA